MNPHETYYPRPEQVVFSSTNPWVIDNSEGKLFVLPPNTHTQRTAIYVPATAQKRELRAKHLVTTPVADITHARNGFLYSSHEQPTLQQIDFLPQQSTNTAYSLNGPIAIELSQLPIGGSLFLLLGKRSNNQDSITKVTLKEDRSIELKQVRPPKEKPLVKHLDTKHQILGIDYGPDGNRHTVWFVQHGSILLIDHPGHPTQALQTQQQETLLAVRRTSLVPDEREQLQTDLYTNLYNRGLFNEIMRIHTKDRNEFPTAIATDCALDLEKGFFTVYAEGIRNTTSITTEEFFWHLAFARIHASKPSVQEEIPLSVFFGYRERVFAIPWERVQAFFQEAKSVYIQEIANKQQISITDATAVVEGMMDWGKEYVTEKLSPLPRSFPLLGMSE